MQSEIVRHRYAENTIPPISIPSLSFYTCGCKQIHMTRRERNENIFLKKTAVTAAATASAALLAFSPLDSAGAKTIQANEPHVLQASAEKTPEDAAKLIDIISQSIYKKDGVYYFDGEKAVELGLDQEQAQIIQKLWDSSTEFLTVLSQCIEKTDGEYTFNKEKAVELGFTEKEALIVDQLFTAFSQSLHILQSALIEEDGVYTFDQELAEKAGAGKKKQSCVRDSLIHCPRNCLKAFIQPFIRLSKRIKTPGHSAGRFFK